MTPDEQKERAQSLEKAGQHGEAATAWKILVEHNPQEANSWWGYGKALRASNQHEAAIHPFRETVRLAPSFKSGWAFLAEAYFKVQKVEEAEKAAMHAIRLDPNYAYPYSIVSTIRGQRKDWAGQATILGRLHDTGNADAYDLNALAIAHANQLHHGEAIRFYKLSAKKQLLVYPHFNVGLTYEKIGQPLDAFDAYQRSLSVQADYEPAIKALARVQKLLLDRESALNQRTPELPRREWFSNYINPFELFGAGRSEEIDDLDLKRYAGLKKRLLHGLALEDGKCDTLDGHGIDTSTVENAHKDLLDPEARRFHWSVFSNEPLLKFLTRGNIRLFLRHDGLSPRRLIDELDDQPEFRRWLGVIFAKQFNLSLGHFMKSEDFAAVEVLLSGRRWTQSEDNDVAFERMHRLVSEWLGPLDQLRSTAKTSVPSVEEIGSIIGGQTPANERLRILRALPIQFREQINQAATAVRSIAIDCYNKHDLAIPSRDILKIAQSLPLLDAKVFDQLKEDRDAIEKIIQSDAANQFEALIFKDKTLRISRKGVAYGNQTMRAQDVRSLAWGIYVHRVNGVETKHNYSITIGGADGAILVSWDNDGLIVGLAKKVFRGKDAELPVRDLSAPDQDRYFGSIVEALFKNVVPVLIGHIVETFEAGGTIPVGDCTFSKAGAAFRTGLIFKDDHRIPWAELDTASQNGEIFLFHRMKRSVRIRFNAKGTANAVMLPALCHVMKK
jgi:tetratricopeptide (TPR) repeat protein